MLAVVVQPALAMRSVVSVVAASALLLPIPARCAADCAHCRAARGAASDVRACCKHRAAGSADLSATATRCVHDQTPACGCNLQSADRTFAPVEQTLPFQSLLSALPSGQPLLSDAVRGIGFAAGAFADLPPPVPHRILHCSWII